MTAMAGGAGDRLLWLDGMDEQDNETWRTLWETTRTRRPHDHPGYLQAMGTDGLFPAMVVYGHATGARVFYSFYWRSLVDLPFFAGALGPAIHIVSPYGYGGPLYEGPEELRRVVSAEFEASFAREAARRGVVSEFIREDLFQWRLANRSQGEHVAQQPNVVVRLDREPETIWRDYQPKVRKNVKRARQHDLRVVFDDSGASLDQFLAVYHGTMERTGAAGSFFMGKERFELLGRTLGAAGGLTYVHVFDGEEMVSTELLLLSTDTIYSFLGGTAAAAFDKRPNDLLKHEVIDWGRRRGFKHYVLGGGISPEDGIFRYKRAFDPEGISSFFVRRIQHDPSSYNLLINQRRSYEGEQGRAWLPREDYFPAYLS